MGDLDQIFESARASEAFVAETGGLPEISAASAALQAAINQTRGEIDCAVFAGHIGTSPDAITETLRSAIDSGRYGISTSSAVAEEGEAGLKRSELGHRLNTIEGALTSLMGDLVCLRVDLVVSKLGFEADKPASR